jgi:Holliday junction resolvase-like predicted endonuclease
MRDAGAPLLSVSAPSDWPACCSAARATASLRASYRTPVGEIDIIARRGQALAFVEVKARTDLETAAAAIGAR